MATLDWDRKRLKMGEKGDLGGVWRSFRKKDGKWEEVPHEPHGDPLGFVGLYLDELARRRSTLQLPKPPQ